MEKAIIINELDNVAVALSNLKKGDIILGIELIEDIPEKHKFSLKIRKSLDNLLLFTIIFKLCKRE